ncbi:TIGR04255 family protein [Nostocales cyanobacterium LEGE 11386]|nr:TIGR04255 family protein [Nostocales cyanobacterium LEGE 11386]
MVKNHETWRNPPLQEAVFEIRFPSVSDYALFAGGMAISQQQEFPTTQKLQAAEIPEIVELSGLVRHRFISPDESLLFQTGPDVLSVNSIAYKGFANFLENIEKILIATEKFVSLSTLSRLGLRYINRFSHVDYPPSILNINLPFQNTDILKTQLLQLREMRKLDDEGVILSINVQFPVEPKDLILDLDISFNSSEKSWDLEMILDWTDKAHNVIWENFQYLVSQNEKEVRI